MKHSNDGPYSALAATNVEHLHIAVALRARYDLMVFGLRPAPILKAMGIRRLGLSR